ncbi:MAG: formylglycine-generating enzyme family protein [Pirellulaceae bacterium]|nr:formylglycine-generating enzyme family protein [Pirellulaceae bacterium]
MTKSICIVVNLEKSIEPIRQSILKSLLGLVLAMPLGVSAEDTPTAPANAHKALPNPAAEASHEDDMQPYDEPIRYSNASVEMVPIPGGTFVMGSPEDEAGRESGEGPQHEVKIAPFWMSTYEITWDVYEVWMYDTDMRSRKLRDIAADNFETAAEEYQVSQPTPPYVSMDFGMGRRGYPAICMTQFAARIFCKWLTEKTGRYYRLPTEAEWEYACRAGTTTPYYFGDDPNDLDDYAWYFDNSDEAYQKVGTKKPNPWGLFDMHGNVSEWVLDQYDEEFYSRSAEDQCENPLALPLKEFPRVVRGGSWDDDPEMLRSATRIPSTKDWKRQDPQLPKSIWYHTDADFVGFRIIRPLAKPTEEEKQDKWDVSLPTFDRKAER